MWIRNEPWQLQQLTRLAYNDPERLETVLNTLWRSFPGLLPEVAIAAVDQESLSVDDCARLLEISPAEVEERLVAFRQHAVRTDRAVVHHGDRNVAKLVEGQVCVWEVVRQYRKLGSVERLSQAFPAVPKHELAAALKYAELHPYEIENQIQEYEAVLARKRAEYPFTK
jgi:uncharacterized protein (DUF433 family)